MAVTTKDEKVKLKFVYENSGENMTFSNVNPNASDDELVDLADGLNYLKPQAYKRLYMVEECELENK